VKTIQPRKQHKMLFKAPLNMRYRHFSAPLSDSLKASHHFDSVPLRKGDTVRIMRGDRKGAEGKVTSVDRRKYRLFIEGVTQEKVDGSNVPAPIHPSKVMITNLNLDDKWRRESLKVETVKEAKAPEEKKKATKPKRARAKKKPAHAAPTTERPSRRKRQPTTSTKKEKGETETG